MTETESSGPAPENAELDLDFAPLDQLFDRLHQELFPVFGGAAGPWGIRSPTLASAVSDVEDIGTAYVIRSELPGFPKELIDVRVQGRVVHVKAEQAESKDSGSPRNYLRQERTYRGFERSFQLPEPVAADQVAASFKDGVLELTVPKAHPVTERKVPVA